MAKDQHPQEVLDGLRAALAGGLAPGYVVRGEELFYRNAALDLLRERARAANLEVCAHDPTESGFDLARLQDDFAGGGLFSAGRLVIVHNPATDLRLLVDMNDDGDFADPAEEVGVGTPFSAPLAVTTTASGAVRVLAAEGVVSGPVR